MDKIMNSHYGYPEDLDRRFKIFFIVFLLLAMSEYTLHVSSRYCHLKHEYQDLYEFEMYYGATFPQLFLFVPLNIYGAIYSSLLTVHASIVLSYNDLFIILLSIALALRFKQITDKLERHYKQIKRLLLQINFDNVALTGCRMFRITRGIVLSIAGAVVTYELVLIQFNMATNVKL
ncbi:unnamed protein product [Phaedon cochleariae]|uniref:Gustatory receptor n=1 Tax=Phaedon cochleariae TaxID=80249 RepID=A0A9N9SM36_PHACE|nr:unnamed protein product [Phaedon cochleariae]